MNFTKFQEQYLKDYNIAFSDLTVNGKKTKHWIWSIFPISSKLDIKASHHFCQFDSVSQVLNVMQCEKGSACPGCKKMLDMIELLFNCLKKKKWNMYEVMGGDSLEYSKKDAKKVIQNLTMFYYAAKLNASGKIMYRNLIFADYDDKYLKMIKTILSKCGEDKKAKRWINSYHGN